MAVTGPLPDGALAGTALAGTALAGTALAGTALAGTALPDGALAGTALAEAGRPAAEAALAGRKELALLQEPSVAAVAAVLAVRCRNPAAWIRAAVCTLARFATQVAAGDQVGLLRRGRADPTVASRSLATIGFRHDGCSAGQVASLAFGPKLWWRIAGVDVPWREPAAGRVVTEPIPSAGRGDDLERDVRLLLLALVGTGLTADELLAARLGNAGSLDATGAVVPDLAAEPLAVAYQPAEGGDRRITFLSFEARRAVRRRLADRSLGPDDPLLLPAEMAAPVRTAAMARSRALISAGNDVNVALCRATGDFFRAWGMPGARFDARRPPTSNEEAR